MDPLKKFVFTLTLSGLLTTPVIASEVFEHEQLALVLQQLENAQRLTLNAHKNITPKNTDRFWFDYERLTRDIKRIQVGIEHYMVPHRAQPRELHEELTSSYTRTLSLRERIHEAQK